MNKPTNWRLVGFIAGLGLLAINLGASVGDHLTPSEVTNCFLSSAISVIAFIGFFALLVAFSED